MIKGIELVDWRNKDEVIRFYETNKLYFDNYQIQTQPDSIVEMIDIKLTYCDALISKNHLTDCFEILTHVNIMLNKLEKSQTDSYNSRFERYLFTEGIVLGYLKRYEESQSNFKKLAQIDPKNDLYKDWIESNNTKIISKQSNIVGFAGFGIIMLDLILDTVFNIRVSKYLGVSGFIIMTLGFAFPYLLRQTKQFIKRI